MSWAQPCGHLSPLLWIVTAASWLVSVSCSILLPIADRWHGCHQPGTPSLELWDNFSKMRLWVCVLLLSLTPMLKLNLLPWLQDGAPAPEPSTQSSLRLGPIIVHSLLRSQTLHSNPPHHFSLFNCWASHPSIPDHTVPCGEAIPPSASHWIILLHWTVSSFWPRVVPSSLVPPSLGIETQWQMSDDVIGSGFSSLWQALSCLCVD